MSTPIGCQAATVSSVAVVSRTSRKVVNGTRSPIPTRRSAAGTPRIDCRKMALMMLKTAVFRPMPQAREKTATSMKPGCRIHDRNA